MADKLGQPVMTYIYLWEIKLHHMTISYFLVNVIVFLVPFSEIQKVFGFFRSRRSAVWVPEAWDGKARDLLLRLIKNVWNKGA